MLRPLLRRRGTSASASSRSSESTRPAAAPRSSLRAARRASGSPSRTRPAGGGMKTRVPELDVAPALRRRAPKGRPAVPLPSVVGLHRDVDGASATLSPAWPHPHLTSPTSSRPASRCVFCGINPGRVSAAAAAHFANPRNDFWRLLHDAGFTPRLYEPARAVRAARARLRRDERRLPDDARLGRPAARRLRRGAARAARARAAAARDRVRRQGGLPRRVRRAARARAAGARARRRPALFVLPSTSPANAAVPVRRAAALVPRAARVARAGARAAVRALVARRRTARVLLVRWSSTR